MKWRNLSPEILRNLASDFFDNAHDMEFERESIAEERGFDAVAAVECVARRLNREAARRVREVQTYSVAPNLHVTYDCDGWVFRWTDIPPDRNQPRAMPSLFEAAMWLWNDGQGLSHEEIDAVIPNLLALRRAARRGTAGGAAAAQPPNVAPFVPHAASAPGERVYEVEPTDDASDIIADNGFEDP